MNSKKVFPPTILLIAILSMVALHFVLPAIYRIPSPWNLLGIFPLILGTALNVTADNLFRKLGTTIKPGEEASLLVTSGPFRLTRNPMYLGFTLILTGVAVLLGSLAPFIVIPVFVVWIDRTFIQAEERMLADQFEAAWQEYRKKARRWI